MVSKYVKVANKKVNAVLVKGNKKFHLQISDKRGQPYCHEAKAMELSLYTFAWMSGQQLTILAVDQS